MGKGKFLNHKLGKSVSRKADLLKSAINARTHRDPPNRLMTPAFPKKGIEKP